jgi:RluA family pseudouridine synthase
MRKRIRSAQPVLDALAELFPDASRTTLRQMLQNDRVRVNGEVVRNARLELASGDQLAVGSRVERASLPPELSILHEDDDIIVVFKTHGLLTVATEREKETTAQAYLNEYLREKGEGRVHVVHRLDRETSGVMLFAKSFEVREKLKDRFAAHDIDRIYVAVIEGAMKPPRGTIQSNLLERKDLKMASVKHHKDAKLAVTHYRTIESNDRWSMLEITLETGRKNQIRAHLSEAGHPVIGDRLYGSSVNPIGRLGLHAQLLGFDHPATGKRMAFTAPIPGSFRKLFA